jgi:diacylglycerol O-acyltransferase / wax synthase
MWEAARGVDRSTRASRLERLSPLDVSNLRVEDHGLPMHVAALAIVEGTPLIDASGQLRLDELRGLLDQRLDQAPRLRQALCRPRLGLGPPLWVDDRGFNIRDHVRTRAVPAPGDEATLLKVCAELNEPPLDRSRPLWEMWVLTGLADGNVALLIRLHHVVADGIAALALIGALLDVAPDAPTPVPQRWLPRPMPNNWELLVDNLHQRAAAVAGALSRLRHPAPIGRRLVSVGGQVRELLREGFAPRVSFNRPVGRRRRLLLVRADLARAKAVAHAHEAKVNDVVLAAVAGGARRLLEVRGELKPGLVLRVSVPISIRSPRDETVGGNRVGIMLVPLPVWEADPIRRLDQISRATAERKRQPPYQPGARFAQAWIVQAMFLQRLVNLFTSNLPGPVAPLYFAGARLLEVFQVGVVQGNVTLSVGVLSYAGELNFAVVADADAVPDVDAFADGLSNALDRLGAGGGGDLGSREDLSTPRRSREPFAFPGSDMEGRT